MFLTLVLGATLAQADTLPTVSADPASKVGVTSALLSGKVNPNGAPGDGITSWRFEYRPADGTEWWSAAEGSLEESASQESNPVDIEAIPGFGSLQPGESYEFRLVAFNAAGQAETPPQSFSMDAATVPTLATKPAQDIGLTLATLEGSVNPEGGNVNEISDEILPIEWQLWYAPEEEPNSWGFGGSGTIEGAEAKSTGPIDVKAELPAGTLSSGHKYLARLVAYYTPFSPEAEAISPAPFETEAAANPIVLIDPVADITSTTASFSGLVNPNAPGPNASLSDDEKAAYAINWRFSCVPECPGLEGSLEADDQNHSVNGDAALLEPNTNYAVTLVAEGKGVKSEASESFKTAAVGPIVATGTNTPEAPGETLVRGYVNPRNDQVSDCHFEFGTTTAYGQSLPCSVSPGSGGKPVEVTMQPTGLQQGATYHFKLVATNAADTSESDDALFATWGTGGPSCPNQSRREEQHATHLPDCRAYEMVSPPDKNGSDVMADTGRTRAAVDGGAVAFASLGGFGDVRGTGIATEYMAQRTAAPGTNGWATHAITPRQESLTFLAAARALDPLYEGEFSEDLSKGVFRAWSPVAGPNPDPDVAEVENLYVRKDLRSPGAGSYELASPCPGCEAPLQPIVLPDDMPRLAGASSDFSKLIFGSRLRLTDSPELPAPFEPKLYKWADGKLHWVGQIPPLGEGSCGGSGPACVAAPRSSAGQSPATASAPRYTQRTISEDGSRVSFTVGGSYAAIDGDLYLRDDRGTASAADDTTTTLNAPTDGDGSGETTATYEYASTGVGANGEREPLRVFFTTKQNLVSEHDDEAKSLYMWDEGRPANDRLVLLSVDRQPLDDPNGVSGVMGASEDGRTVYFLQAGQMAAGQPSLASETGIYRWYDDGSGAGDLSYIGALTNAGNDAQANLTSIWYLSPLDSRVSPDGRHLLFSATSGNGLTGKDHGSTCLIAANFRAGPDSCKELYLYSADTEELTCVSCDPAGGPATSNSQVQVKILTGASNTSFHLNRPLSVDGRYVFFATEEALDPAGDSNGAPDVYRYDAASGSQQLISSGTSPTGSYFVDASSNGRDAFLLTSQRLSGWDVDGAYDLYDARIDGGLAEPGVTPAPCVGESCLPTPPSPPSAPSAPSGTLRAPDDPKPKRCPTGKRPGKGRKGKTRCVAKDQGREKNQKQQTKKHHKQQKRNANSDRRQGR